MKIGIVGAGAVGMACMYAMTLRGSAQEIVLVNRNRERARGAVADLRYGAVLAPPVDLRDGSFDDLRGAAVIAITAGVNEKSGGATDREDPAGRLRLLRSNAAIYRDLVPRIVTSAPDALLLVVTDPPDPLADIARTLAGHDAVISSGTLLDSLRFRFHLGQRIGVDPRSIHADIIGEHGTSQVFLWSTASVAGRPVIAALRPDGADASSIRKEIEGQVRYANITIIEGTGASRLGIGVAVARIVEVIARNTQEALPIASFQRDFGVTLSLPSQVGRRGVERVLMPPLAAAEQAALEASADTLRRALASVDSANA